LLDGPGPGRLRSRAGEWVSFRSRLHCVSFK
jgi:hypothetical protein